MENPTSPLAWVVGRYVILNNTDSERFKVVGVWDRPGPVLALLSDEGRTGIAPWLAVTLVNEIEEPSPDLTPFDESVFDPPEDTDGIISKEAAQGWVENLTAYMAQDKSEETRQKDTDCLLAVARSTFLGWVMFSHKVAAKLAGEDVGPVIGELQSWIDEIGGAG